MSTRDVDEPRAKGAIRRLGAVPAQREESRTGRRESFDFDQPDIANEQRHAPSASERVAEGRRPLD